MKHTIVLECELAEPPQKVWKALTVPELRAKWLMPKDGSCDRVACEVLEAKPPRLLRLSWHDEHEDESLDSVVTFELFPTIAGGTLLRLVHSGFESGSAQAPMALLKAA